MIKIVRTVLSVFVLAVFAATSFAQDLTVTEKVLPNGLKVLLKEEHKAPVVTFQIWYRVGSRNECLGKTGLSHLLEHMMFKGTKKYGPKTFSQTVQRNGGNDNAFTSHDYTAYFENFAVGPDRDRARPRIGPHAEPADRPQGVPVRARRGEGRAPHAVLRTIPSTPWWSR